KLCARILIDQHRPLAQFLELLGEDVADDTVARVLRLVVGEAEMALLRLGARGNERQQREDEQAAENNAIEQHGGVSSAYILEVCFQRIVTGRWERVNLALIDSGLGVTGDQAWVTVGTRIPPARKRNDRFSP